VEGKARKEAAEVCSVVAVKDARHRTVNEMPHVRGMVRVWSLNVPRRVGR